MRVVDTNTRAEKPSGLPFIVAQCPFQFDKQIDSALVNLDEDKVSNWPMVYILANDTSAYVGQTNSVARRMTQHMATQEKRDFHTANIIFNEEFNSSAIIDYENLLIKYMQGDGRYSMTNKNDGMAETNYFSRERYLEMFESLWGELKKLDLVDHTIDEIEESEVFKYSPFKSLTSDQQVALEKINKAIENGLKNAKPIVVQGMPGTGKTVLAVYLLKMLRDNPKYADMNIRIIEPVTSLRKSLSDSLKGISGLSKDDIIAPGDLAKERFGYDSKKKHSFDIVLIDESHKLKQRVNLGTQFSNYDKTNRKLGLPKEATQMDWIIDQVRLPIFFYDPLQAIGPSCLSEENISQTLGNSVEAPIVLDSQMRVKGGKSYLEYITNILSDNNPKRESFSGYDLFLHQTFSSFKESFDRDYEKHSLSRMIAGYAWPWVSKGKFDSDIFDIEYEGVGLRWNRTYDNWVGRGFNNTDIAHEVGCIHSIQGYDLSYAYVIIGDDIGIDDKTGLLRANKNNYYDTNGKNTASQDELTQYIKNIYYVLLTRGVFGTHIYVADKKLRDYFERFF